MKAKDVQVYPITADTRVLRSRTWDRLKFEIEYALQRGTTANSYLIQADKTALFDPPGESFTDIFSSALQKRIDPKTIDYVILGHVNPNRAVTLQALLELAPQITFVTSNPGAISLKKILEDATLNIKAIKGDETLDLGQGHDLEFILTPSPRWPDRMCTYDPKTQILFSDKLFGAHVCGDQVFDEGWAVYSEDRRYYFDCLMAPNVGQTENALEKLSEKNATLYATGHGPLVRYGLSELTNSYNQWVQQQKESKASVVLIYASAYGSTATLANAIARGITKANVAVESINCEFADPDEIKVAVEQADGFIMGSPTLGGHAPTPIQTALGIVLATADKNKLYGVFGSYGWSGEAIDLLEQKFKDAGYRQGFDPIRVKFKPNEVTLQYCEEAGTDFAQILKRRQKKRALKQPVGDSQADRTEQAVGRIVGSLCVVTTQKGDLSNAMLASWVSQATFTPPGLTVAVSKERAIESMLHAGDRFILNILPEGNLQLQKQFTKNYAPGQDRFENIETEVAENGCAILKGTLAYLECQVNSRMECGDHWLVYAVADKGKVFDNEGVTAVHHRKSGSYY